jgi:hypothetical protein
MSLRRAYSFEKSDHQFRRELSPADVAWCAQQQGKPPANLSPRKRRRLDKLLAIYERGAMAQKVIGNFEKGVNFTERAVAGGGA